MNGDLIPITDEQAKAAQELAKLGGKAADVLLSAGGFLREILGDVPKNLVGILGGDWLANRRADNLAQAVEKAREKLRERGIDRPEAARLPLVMPLLQAAAEESDPILQEIWAALLAAAMDTRRRDRVRGGFTEVVKQMDPLDVLAFRDLSIHRLSGSHDIAERLKRLGMRPDQGVIVTDKLLQLGVARSPIAGVIEVSPLGRELLLALE